jgi:hypothetical protein
VTSLEKIVPASTITKMTEEYASARDAVLSAGGSDEFTTFILHNTGVIIALCERIAALREAGVVVRDWRAL